MEAWINPRGYLKKSWRHRGKVVCLATKSSQARAALRGTAAENAQLIEASNDLNIPRTQYLKQQAFPCLKGGLEILIHTGCYEEVRTVLIAIYKVISCVLASRSMHREK